MIASSGLGSLLHVVTIALETLTFCTDQINFKLLDHVRVVNTKTLFENISYLPSIL